MGVNKSSLAAHEFDVVECEVFQNAPALHVDDFTLVVHKIVDSKILLKGVVDSIEAALLQPGEVERGFTKGLAGNGAGVDAAPAHVPGAFDYGHAFAKVGGLRAGLFTGRPTADHEQIEIIARSHKTSRIAGAFACMSVAWA